MIKGCSKRMIVLKNTGSDLFDEAYFVVKPRSAVSPFRNEKAFIDEAHRILNESVYPQITSHKDKRSGKTSFFAGAFCGLLFGFLCGAVTLMCLK